MSSYDWFLAPLACLLLALLPYAAFSMASVHHISPFYSDAPKVI